MNIQLTALHRLVGDYGTVDPGDIFQVSPEDAESLEARGLAERYKAKTEEIKAAWKLAVARQPKGAISNGI